MSEIHFVFEKPEKAVRPDKKRSRLVTSCDACRTKKIKCRPTSNGDDICEACSATGTRCVYEERDRIRAERGIANFTVAPSNEASTSNQGSSRALTSRTSSSFPSSSSYSVGSVKPTQALQDNSRSSPPPNPPSSSYLSPSADVNPEEHFLDNYPPLFDPYRPYYPHSRLLPHLVDVFLAYAGGIFPFLDPEETMSAAVAGTILPSIANAISAYAARFEVFISELNQLPILLINRFSDKVPQSPEGRHASGDSYLEAAKYSLDFEDLGTLKRIHSQILIAWTENGRGKTNNFWEYSRSAALAAFELRLGSEDCIRMESSEKAQNDLRMTFWSVVWMELVACSVVGKSPLFSLNECTTSMPSPEVLYRGSLSRVSMYGALRSVFVAMRTLNEAANVGKPDSPSTYRDTSLRQIQYAVTEMRDALNPALLFTTDNFAQAEIGREGYILYLVHVLTHSIVIVTHCPSLFFTSQSVNSVIECPRLDVAWSSAVTIIDIYLIIRDINYRAPVALSSFFLPISFARGALMMAGSNPRSVMDGLLIPRAQFEEMNHVYLAHSMDLLAALSTYWASMLEVKIAAQPVALYSTQSASSHWRVHRVPISTFYLERTPNPSMDFFAQASQPSQRFYQDYTPSVSIFDTDVWNMHQIVHKPLEIEARDDQDNDSAWSTSYSSSELVIRPFHHMYDN